MASFDRGQQAAGKGEPRKILKLDEDVVNRIAAGEVVQRPANAVKELLENSLDAGATSITVMAKQGGLKLLQIQDNGHGIRREDLPIVCERFTTSKLREFGDLRTMSTFGFRGEALASITHTAKVTITSKPPSAAVAYKAKYSDGRLVPAAPGQRADPKPCAGVTGTTILAEELFYNMDTRRRAFKSPGEQYRGILDVITRYAVHFGDRGISFTCKKHGQASPDLHTPPKSSRLANIRVAFGAALSRELVDLECSKAEHLLDGSQAADTDASGESTSTTFAFRAKGLMSGANYSAKRSEFILFINDRLVESASIKKAVEAAYKDVLPKNMHPYVYLGITMPSQHLDVNVHPTKREVHFLHEEELLQSLHEAVQDKLRGANQSRTFYSQVILPDMNFGSSGAVGEVVKDTNESQASVTSSGSPRETEDPSPRCTITPVSTVQLHPTQEHLAQKHANAEGTQAEYSQTEASDGSGGSGRKRNRAAPAADLDSFAAGVARGPTSAATTASRRRADVPSSSKKQAASAAPQKLVRTDRRAGSLDAFVRPSQPLFAATSASTNGGGTGASKRMTENGGKMGSGSEQDDKVTEVSETSANRAEEATGVLSAPGRAGSAVMEISSDDEDGSSLDCVCPGDTSPPTETKGANGEELGDGIADHLEEKIPRAPGLSKGKDEGKRRRSFPAKPFAGIGTRARCDCCGGKRLRGPSGSIVLTAEAGAEGVDGEGHVVTPSPDTSLDGGAAARATQQHKRPAAFVETSCRYNSVRSLIGDFKAQAHKGLTQMLKKYTFVGMVDLHLSLVQFNTKLILVNHTELSKEAFFQMTIRRFGIMPRRPLATPLPVRPLVRTALDLPEAGWVETDGNKDELAQDACNVLAEKAAMLDEYFMMKLTRGANGDDGSAARGAGSLDEQESVGARQQLRLESLPLLLEGHAPEPEGLPVFLLRLATEVDWTEERTCFEGIAAELALYYSTLPLAESEGVGATSEPSHKGDSREGRRAGIITGRRDGPGETCEGLALAPAPATAVVQHVMYPSFRLVPKRRSPTSPSDDTAQVNMQRARWALLPPKAFATDGTVMQLACLERLYKVFERC